MPRSWDPQVPVAGLPASCTPFMYIVQLPALQTVTRLFHPVPTGVVPITAELVVPPESVGRAVAGLVVVPDPDMATTSFVNPKGAPRDSRRRIGY